MTGAQEQEFLEHMRAGMRRGAAAEAMGLTRREVLDYIGESAEFRFAVEDAEGLASEHVEEALYQAAVSGSVPAAKLWLELRKPRPAMLPALMDDVAPSGPEDDFEAILRLSRE